MNKIKVTKGRFIFNIINSLLMAILLLVTISPFVYIFIMSFQSPADFARYGMSFPRHISIENYSYLLGGGSVLIRAIGVSTLVAVFGTLLNLLATSAFAYGLSKKFLPGRVQITTGVFITMLFSGGLIPLYFVIRSTGLINTLWAIIIPQLINTFYMFIMRNFFQTIPDSLEESARIDGANDITILARIILPISMPIIASVGLFYAVDHWNDYFSPLAFISNSEIWPLQLVVNNIINTATGAQNVAQEAQKYRVMPQAASLRMATIIISIIPIMCVYPFLQKYFVKGIMIGSIKG